MTPERRAFSRLLLPQAGETARHLHRVPARGAGEFGENLRAGKGARRRPADTRAPTGRGAARCVFVCHPAQAGPAPVGGLGAAYPPPPGTKGSGFFFFLPQPARRAFAGSPRSLCRCCPPSALMVRVTSAQAEAPRRTCRPWTSTQA